jgi:hypothetical protein
MGNVEEWCADVVLGMLEADHYANGRSGVCQRFTKTNLPTSKYKIKDGAVVDSDKAQKCCQEATNWNGQNYISRVTGSQWEHQTLYRSAKGRYYIEYRSDWQVSMPHAEWKSGQEAAEWLILNDHELPADLADMETEVCE